MKEASVEDRSSVELEVLYRISQAMAHGHDVSLLLKEVLDIMETEMGMSYGTLTLRRPDTDIFVIEASCGLTAEEKKRGQYRLGEGITGRVAQSAKPAVVPDISLDRLYSLGDNNSRFDVNAADYDPYDEY